MDQSFRTRSLCLDDISHEVLRLLVDLGGYCTAQQASFLLNVGPGQPVRARTDMNGSMCETITSLPFGDGMNVTSTCADGDVSPLHFTGKRRDLETGLDFFGARYNSASFGRLMGVDRDAADDYNPQSLNRFTYALNNPIKWLDRDGNCVAPAVGPGQVGICIEAYIRSKRLGFLDLGYGDNRGPVANDPKATFRTQTPLTIDLKSHGINKVDRAGVSRTMLTSDHVGSTKSEISDVSVDKDGNIHFKIHIMGQNGTKLHAWPPANWFAPGGTIGMTFEFEVTSSGEIEVVGGTAKKYPSISVFAYDNGSVQDLFEQTESGHSGDLNGSEDPIPIDSQDDWDEGPDWAALAGASEFIGEIKRSHEFDWYMNGICDYGPNSNCE